MSAARTRSRKSVAVEFTNPDKVLYPKAGFTKAQVIRYYLEIAPWLLPHLENRPVTLKRFPHGTHGEAFYEKDAPGFTPAWVKTFPVPRREGGDPIRYIVVNDARTLAWCANLATLEFHPFLHRIPDLATPTHLALDLDPGEGADLRTCIEVAQLVREVLAALDLVAVPKVSGSKGLQLHVPLNTGVTYEAAQAFARSLAELLHRRHPDLVVSEMAKARRHGRVFIDWSQNSDFKTTVGVYSLRAKRETPFVSMPVTWDELRRAQRTGTVDALYFTPESALARVRKLGDLFASVQTLEQRLPSEFAAAAPRQRRKAPRALAAYEAKRDFARTSEPPAPLPRRSAQGSRRRFVVQKHAASHLHYDFRLEISDTLKSWAVPKGLPESVGGRHSAFATEDHPLDYLSFEGVIPPGEYGGGTVMVWDIGTFEVVEGNYWKGFLRVFLRGKKLRGEWTLTRAHEEGEKTRWVIEKRDGGSVSTLRRRERSALTGRTLEEIAAARDAVWRSDRPAKTAARGSGERRGPAGRKPAAQAARPPQRNADARPRRSGKTRRPRPAASRPATPAPEFMAPMLARVVTELPAGDEWLYEVKWDGYRALAIKHEDAVWLLSRRNNPLNHDFPSVVAAVRGINATTALLDGEVVALDAEGRPQFQALQHRASAAGDIVYYAFDLLQLEGEDLRSLPLEQRKERLAAVVSGSPVRFSASLPGTPGQIVAEATRLGLEGVIAKRRQSTYASGERSGAWQKLKLSPEQEFVVGGYKPGNPVESLLVGYYEAGRLMFAGKVRQGLNPRLRAELGRLLQPLATSACPFANLPNSRKSHFGEGVTREQMKELRWVQPKLVAQVSFTEWTRAGNLRHATYKGLREDKDPRDVVREPVAVRE